MRVVFKNLTTGETDVEEMTQAEINRLNKNVYTVTTFPDGVQRGTRMIVNNVDKTIYENRP